MPLNRRQLLKLLLSGVAGSIVDTDQLLWTPNTKTIFIPHPKQVEFFNRPIDMDRLYGIPYHESNACAGTWMGIVRSTTPLPFREILQRLTINTKEPLYVINSGGMGRTIPKDTTNRIGDLAVKTQPDRKKDDSESD